MDVDKFIREEVQHQGFDLKTEEGKQRVEWMQNAWRVATEEWPAWPGIEVIEKLGQLVEQIKNLRGFRSAVNVRVGNRFAPHCGDVRYLMELLCRSEEPDTKEDCQEWYRCFEIIHPFEDGNGRVGKILYNWWLDKLDDPEFPPDLFGHGLPFHRLSSARS